MGCGKDVLKDFINAGTGRCVSLEAVYTSMFLTPGMREMDEWIFAWHMIHAASWRRGAITVVVLTMPRMYQIYEAVRCYLLSQCALVALYLGRKGVGGKFMPPAPGR